eukprot:SAG11_NODE_3661_length_2302_cov_1.768044_3_plen_176_part_00
MPHCPGDLHGLCDSSVFSLSLSPAGREGRAHRRRTSRAPPGRRCAAKAKCMRFLGVSAAGYATLRRQRCAAVCDSSMLSDGAAGGGPERAQQAPALARQDVALRLRVGGRGRTPGKPIRFFARLCRTARRFCTALCDPPVFRARLVRRDAELEQVADDMLEVRHVLRSVVCVFSQ